MSLFRRPVDGNLMENLGPVGVSAILLQYLFGTGRPSLARDHVATCVASICCRRCLLRLIMIYILYFTIAPLGLQYMETIDVLLRQDLPYQMCQAA